MVVKMANVRVRSTAGRHRPQPPSPVRRRLFHRGLQSTMRPDPQSHVSRMGDLRVLFVMATEQEYGEHLRRVITPLVTGVGPVEAAAATGATLGSLAAGNALPDLVF